MRFNILINSEKAIAKLNTLGRKKGKYIESLIEKDIRLEEIEKRLNKLEGGKK